MSGYINTVAIWGLNVGIFVSAAARQPLDRRTTRVTSIKTSGFSDVNTNSLMDLIILYLNHYIFGPDKTANHTQPEPHKPQGT